MVVAIIQARCNSKRFPNKVMKKINGKPLIEYVYKRIQKSKKIKKIIIACSSLISDDPIANYCNKKKYLLLRGSLNNVLSRYSAVLKKYKLNYFVRITGDSPCIDPRLIDKAINIFKNKKCDLVTNVNPRSYPKGISVEVIKSQLIYDVEKKTNITRENKEHITSYFYKKKKNKYNIINFNNNNNYSKYSLAIDTIDDLKRLKSVLKKNFFFDFTWKQIFKTVYKNEN